MAKIQPMYDQEGIRRLMIAVVAHAVECATLHNSERITYKEAWEAADWLDREGRDWFSVLEIGAPGLAFDTWITTTKSRLIQTDNLTHLLYNLTEQIQNLPQEMTHA